jgi:hypothetical protein
VKISFRINQPNLHPDDQRTISQPSLPNLIQRSQPQTSRMKTFTTLTTLTALLSTALAMPSTQASTRSPIPTAWQVSNYTEGCSPAACVYNFNIAWCSGTSEPAFSTTCGGNDLATDFQACDAYEDQYISTKEILLGAGNLTVVVQHKWYDGDITYWIEGNTTISLGPDGFPPAFEIVQSSEYAIA